jgi:FAD:protein FMN transferase
MGMPITIEIVDPGVDVTVFDRAFDTFAYVDATFSPFKDTSEVSRLNSGELTPRHMSADMREVLALAEQTRQETDGYFDVYYADGRLDPCGIVKGWSIQRVADQLHAEGWANFYVDAGGDIALTGHNADGESWRVGIRSPFEPDQIVKVLELTDCGVATSGLYNRGAHIINPHNADAALDQVASVTVIGPNVYEADRFATAAFAMGGSGIYFLESLPGFEGYQIDPHGQALLTTHFSDFCHSN